MPRIRLAVALATALVLCCPTHPAAEVETRPDPAARWRSAGTMQALVSILDDWLDAHSKWDRRTPAPRVRLVSQSEAAARRGTASHIQPGRLRGLYDGARQEILLVEPWDPGNARDVSTLLHELVHHRQAAHDWNCPAAQERPAYRLQDAWLAERGMQADVNWLAVILDSGCTLRNVHPD